MHIPADELVRNPLVAASFDALQKPELFEPAVDLLVEVIAGVSILFLVGGKLVGIRVGGEPARRGDGRIF